MPLPSINKSCYIYNGETGFTARAHGMASDCVCMYVCVSVCVCDCVCQSRARAEILYIYILHYVVWGGRPLSLLLSNVYYRVLRGSLFSVCVSVCVRQLCVCALIICQRARMHTCACA